MFYHPTLDHLARQPEGSSADIHSLEDIARVIYAIRGLTIPLSRGINGNDLVGDRWKARNYTWLLAV
ncbi:hypothetical protein HDF11_005374 [Tunturiibacter psychrotolerans]